LTFLFFTNPELSFWPAKTYKLISSPQNIYAYPYWTNCNIRL